eukprot:TRINITY_DN485_c0_g1_i2.p1 TRINITY_DN485_c0_g1~~TRINITY_DN485_c0_g1_i2.p1  ORF type:complete len:245 (-),score=37.41 TRINITY_DN485_c0_g1_i2:62-796(-)
MQRTYSLVLISLCLCYSIDIVLSPCSDSRLQGIVGVETSKWAYDPTTPTSTISFAVCGVLPGTCGDNFIPGCGVCQNWIQADGSIHGSCLGTSVSTVTNKDSKTIDILVTGGELVNNPDGSSSPRETHIVITCDGTSKLTPQAFKPAAPPPPILAVYDYYIDANYSCSSGISIGWILVIVLICIIVVYLAAGITFNVVKNQKTGVEVIPNLEFWTSAPGMAKDGVLFLWNKFMGAIGKSEYQSI